MSKLYFNYDGIKNDVIPSINETLIKLNNALVISNNITAPGVYGVSSVLETAKTEIQANIAELNKTKEWLERCCRIYKSRIESMESSLNKVNIEKIMKKEDWIKEITYEE